MKQLFLILLLLFTNIFCSEEGNLQKTKLNNFVIPDKSEKYKVGSNNDSNALNPYYKPQEFLEKNKAFFESIALPGLDSVMCSKSYACIQSKNIENGKLISMTPNCKEYVYLTNDGKIFLKANYNEDKDVEELETEIKDINCIALSPCGKYMFYSSNNNICYNVIEAKKQYNIPNPHQQEINYFAFNPRDSNYLISSTDNQTILWDFKKYRQDKFIKSYSATFTPNGQIFIVGHKKKIEFYTGLFNIALLNQYELNDYTKSISCSKDSLHALITTAGNQVLLFDLLDMEHPKALSPNSFLKQDITDSFTCSDFHPKKPNLIVLGTKSGECIFWDTKKDLKTDILHLNEEIKSLEFNIDGKYLIVNCPKKIFIINLDQHELYPIPFNNKNIHKKIITKFNVDKTKLLTECHNFPSHYHKVINLSDTWVFKNLSMDDLVNVKDLVGNFDRYSDNIKALQEKILKIIKNLDYNLADRILKVNLVKAILSKYMISDINNLVSDWLDRDINLNNVLCFSEAPKIQDKDNAKIDTKSCCVIS